MVARPKHSLLCSIATDGFSLKKKKKKKREREKRKAALKNTGFFSHNKVLRRNREAMEFNLDIESQMKESNQILTN